MMQVRKVVSDCWVFAREHALGVVKKLLLTKLAYLVCLAEFRDYVVDWFASFFEHTLDFAKSLVHWSASVCDYCL